MKQNEKKELLCNKHYNLLKVMRDVTGGVILQQQLIEIVLKLNYYKNTVAVYRALTELKEGDILKECSSAVTHNKNVFLVFKKYAIRFFQGGANSQKVSSIKIPTSNFYFYRKLSETQYFINYVLAYYRENIIVKSTGLDILQYLDILTTLEIINKKEIRKQIELFIADKENLFLKNSKEKATQYNDRDTITELLNTKKIHIGEFYMTIEKNLEVDVYYLDSTDSLDKKEIEKIYSRCFNALRDILNKENSGLLINFKVCVNTQNSLEVLKSKKVDIHNLEIINLTLDKYIS